MKQFLLLLFAMFLSGCAALAPIRPDEAVRPGLAEKVFPQGSWQLSHAITATLPGGKTQDLLGVSVISPKGIRCALMTVEGIVLFSGRDEGRFSVDRAIPPFDRPGFAEGLMGDLKFLFFSPKARVTGTGRLATGEEVLRFGSPEDGTTDLILREDGTWGINEYSSRAKLVRSLEAKDPAPSGPGLATQMTLKRPGLLGYRLDMRLLEAIPLK